MFGFRNSSLMLEFNFLVNIARSGKPIGSLCLNVVSYFLLDAKSSPPIGQFIPVKNPNRESRWRGVHSYVELMVTF